jgi:hypothetical protein
MIFSVDPTSQVRKAVMLLLLELRQYICSAVSSDVAIFLRSSMKMTYLVSTILVSVTESACGRTGECSQKGAGSQVLFSMSN